jgi:hypothetical protein
MRSRFPDIGPPRLKKSESAGANRTLLEMRRPPDQRPISSLLTLHSAGPSQARVNCATLVYFDLALPPGHWHWIRCSAAKEGSSGVKTNKFYREARQRPSDQLKRLLHLVDRRLDFHRPRALSLARIRGALITELKCRAACYGAEPKPGALLL